MNKKTFLIIGIFLISHFLTIALSQISYSQVVMLELNSVSEVQHKKIMIIGNE